MEREGPLISQAVTERVLAALWNEVLGRSETPRSSDNFFDLGGTSIAMVTLLFRIEEEFSIELAPGTVFSYPSLGELAAAIEKLSTGVTDPCD